MSKNKIFKKVTSCCLTLASVFSLSIPCHAFIEAQNAVENLMYAYKGREGNRNVTVKEYNGIQFCEFYSYGIYGVYSDKKNQKIRCGTFYMSSDVLEREYNEFKRLNSQSYQKFNDENDRFIQYLKNKMDSEDHREHFSLSDCLYLFIINGEIENKRLYDLIKNKNFVYSGLIYETEIDNTQKKDLFKNLGFENNFQNNGYSCSDYNSNSKLKLGVGVLSLVTLATRGIYCN